eukprot:1581018-Rhodomonas_salina.2
MAVHETEKRAQPGPLLPGIVAQASPAGKGYPSMRSPQYECLPGYGRSVWTPSYISRAPFRSI